MRSRGRRWDALLLGGILALLSAGCDNRPTYPKARLTASLQDILQDEHLLRPAVRLIDHTLAVQVEYPDTLAQNETQVGIGPAFDEAARKVLTALHRVLLSTDAQLQFYVVLLSDPKIPGAYLTIVRYVDDIRRANANMLDTPEMFARTVFELDVMGATPLTLDQYIPRDIQLEEFLSWQLARRIQSALADELAVRGVADVGRCGGRFENGEFAFTLNVAPRTNAPLDDATVQKAFEVSTNVIAKVLSGYRFESFDAVRLIHPATGRTLLLPKARLEPFK